MVIFVNLVHTNILQVPKNTQIESVVLQYKPHNSLVIDDQVSIKNDSQEWKSIPITKKKYPLSLIPGQKRDLISLYNTEFTQIDAERLQSLKKPRPEIQESEKYICGHANVNGTTCRRTVPKNELCYIHISSKSIELCNICSEIDNSDDVYGVLVTCISCRFKHHPVCVGITESLTVSKIVGYDWSCPTCKKCDKCNLGDGELINCNVCDRAAHSTCIQSQKYTCQECMKCYGCGNNKVTENIHVQSPSPTFIAGFCISCASLFNAGKFCHLCIKVYKNTNDVPLLSCDECDRYVHVACDDSLVGSTYQEYLDDDEKKYKCVICRGQKGIKMVEIQEKLCLVP